MKKIMAAALFFGIIIGSMGLNASASTGAKDRATWLWNPWMIVNDESGTLSFLQIKQVNKVYLQIDRDIPLKVYRSFISKASANGIRIYALDGAPDWVSPKGYTSQNQLMNWVGNYQSTSTNAQKFSGIHLDVEPYLYSGWTTNQADTIKSYQALLTKAKTSAASMKLPLESDIPFWFDTITYKNTYGKGMLAEWVITNTNSVTVMAYRDSSSAIIDLVKTEIGLAAKHGKSLVIGVETGQSSEGNNLTFFEEGETYMNGQLGAVKSYYAATSGFNGVAIHHVGSWMTMKP